MKVVEAQHTGYRDQAIESLFRSSLFPSSFFDQPVPVRGVCFAAGHDSVRLAQSFAATHLGLGTLTLPINAMTLTDWRHFAKVVAGPRSESNNLGLVLPDLDLASEGFQAKVAESIGATGNTLWFPTATDQRRLIAPLKLALLVYLGLGPNKRMRFLVQSGQHLLIDEGSLCAPHLREKAVAKTWGS